jgi:phosphoribosylformimino-5-aminoimidazole carboxamide ribotide isomerase
MKFRPCIDIHNGQVKQIVGGSLKDAGNRAVENFVSDQNGAFYASMYKELNLKGGHIILLNPKSSEYYDKDVDQALSALRKWPGALQIGGGITPENAAFFLNNGASHVIVTSYVFSKGEFNRENLEKMKKTVGRDRLVLDLSCRKKDGNYYIVTDRWQNFTNYFLTPDLLNMLTSSCAEFLIHAVDAEGKASGIEEEIVDMMSSIDGFPATYAGGVGSYDDLYRLKEIGKNKVDVTIGSALDMFGGHLSLDKILQICAE